MNSAAKDRRESTRLADLAEAATIAEAVKLTKAARLAEEAAAPVTGVTEVVRVAGVEARKEAARVAGVAGVTEVTTVAPAAVTPPVKSLGQLRQEIAEAAAGDGVRLDMLIREYTSRRVEVVKAMDEALSSKRMALAIALHANVMEIPIIHDLAGVLATGFVFKMDEPGETGVKYLSVVLTTPTMKAITGVANRVSSATRISTKDTYGKSLDEIFRDHATPAELELVASTISNSSKWQVKVGVRKRALASGFLKPLR